MAEARKPPAHGTRSRYNHPSDPCHCAQCRAANAAYIRRVRDHQRRAERNGVRPVVNKQGKVVGHQAPLFDEGAAP
jgi:hypothetical protein